MFLPWGRGEGGGRPVPTFPRLCSRAFEGTNWYQPGRVCWWVGLEPAPWTRRCSDQEVPDEWMGGGCPGPPCLCSLALPSLPTLTAPSLQHQGRMLIPLVKLGCCKGPSFSFTVVFDRHGSVIICFSELVSALGFRIESERALWTLLITKTNVMRPCESDPPVSLHVAQRHSVLILASESHTASTLPTCTPPLGSKVIASSLPKVLGPGRYLGSSHFRIFHDGFLPPSPKPG